MVLHTKFLKNCKLLPVVGIPKHHLNPRSPLYKELLQETVARNTPLFASIDYAVVQSSDNDKCIFTSEYPEAAQKFIDEQLPLSYRKY